MSILLCGSILSHAFGALIASVILDSMQGVLGLSAWRWLFIVEGSATILVALWSSTVLPDFPETQQPGWLSEQEIRLAVLRMDEDSDSSASVAELQTQSESLKSGFWMAISDSNVLLLTLAQGGHIVSTSFSVYFPTLAASLGYDRTTALLLCAPPYLTAAVFAFFVSR